MQLSPRNWQAYRHYLEAKATGLTAAEKSDPIVRRNFAVLDGITRGFEHKLQATKIAGEIASLLAALRNPRS